MPNEPRDEPAQPPARFGDDTWPLEMAVVWLLTGDRQNTESASPGRVVLNGVLGNIRRLDPGLFVRACMANAELLTPKAKRHLRPAFRDWPESYGRSLEEAAAVLSESPIRATGVRADGVRASIPSRFWKTARILDAPRGVKGLIAARKNAVRQGVDLYRAGMWRASPYEGGGWLRANASAYELTGDFWRDIDVPAEAFRRQWKGQRGRRPAGVRQPLTGWQEKALKTAKAGLSAPIPITIAKFAETAGMSDKRAASLLKSVESHAEQSGVHGSATRRRQRGRGGSNNVPH